MRQRNVATAFPTVSQDSFTAIILAAGESESIRTYGSNRSLVTVGSSTLLQHQISTLKRKFASLADIVVVLGYDWERTIKHVPKGVRVVLNERWVETTSSHSASLALKSTITPSVIIISGDIYFGIDALTLPKKSTVIMSDMKKEKVGLTSIDGKAHHFAYGLDDKWGQVSYVVGADLTKLRKQLDEKLLLYEVFNNMIAEGVEFDVTRAAVKEINTYQDTLNL